MLLRLAYRTVDNPMGLSEAAAIFGAVAVRSASWSSRRIAARKENSMQRRMSLRGGVGVVAALVALAGAVPVYAQTDGMERRDDRQDDRGAGRDAKQDCKAGDENTRAECR